MLAWMKEILDKFLGALTALLPLSPFAEPIAALTDLPYLGYINYFFPLGDCIKIGVAWITAIGIYYMYSVIARWVKIIA